MKRTSDRAFGYSSICKTSTVQKRHGKWTEEEEAYAEHLVVEFLKGTLMDCNDRCSLRSYLAEKLNCEKMRISKKFCGRSIGKVTKL